MDTICVAGAGTMGGNIASVFSAVGFQVRLCDQNKQQAAAGKERLGARVDIRVQRGKLEAQLRDGIMERILPSEIEECGDCVFALEAIYEDEAAKKSIYGQLEQILPADTVIASNTSSLSITALASGLQDPSRFVGMHFFNPADTMRLVEVIHGEYTSEATMQKTEKIAAEIGKTPIRAKENPGFIVNRILIPMINEAAGLLGEGIASAEDIDTAMQLGANLPMGPLHVGDLVGLDVCLAIMEVLQQETGEDKYRPHPYLRKMVRAGKLGRKTGQGFFDYKH